jgi:hypothetical protein
MTSLALDLAHWLDQRLTDTEVAPTSTTRLYGLEVLGRHPLRVRSVFILEARSIESAVGHPSVQRGIDYDAAALVEFPWIAVGGSSRPGDFAVRQRGRLVRVLTYEGDTASVCRLGVETHQVDDHDDVDA